LKNNWSKNSANKYIKKYKKLGFSKELALRVYTTRLLGRNKELVLHGGGNTSVKTTIKDIDGKKIAIFNQNGYHALDAICVHQDNPITAGKLDGDIVECPSHFWHYNIKTGELQDYLKGVKLQTYPVEERVDGIYIDLQQ